MNKPQTARDAAFGILLNMERNSAYSNLSFGPLSELSAPDADLARSIVRGVLEKKRLLDALLAPFLRKEPEPELRILLRTGLYQILFFDRVPDSAACNETVTVAKKRYGKQRADFVNAVLRAAVRSKEQMFSSIPGLPPAVRHSVSDGYLALLAEQYPDRWESLLDAFDRPRPLYVRCNTLRISPAELALKLNGVPDGSRIRVTENRSEAVRETENGLCYPQGYGSQEAVRMLGALPGETVVDVCACPGGKSFGAALDMENRGTVYAFDLYESKLNALRKGAGRLGLSVIRPSCRDGRHPDPELFGKADRVLCDVPCSGLGTVGAKPEIRYKDPASFDGLYATQAELLEASSAYVRPSGVLVYSTCTWNKKENEQQVRAFLSGRPSFRLAEEYTFLPDGPAGEGFYAARLERVV